MFTQEQQHHQLQILGHHPASPVGCSFLDLPADAFTRGTAASNNSSTHSSSSSDSEGYTSPSAEDCQASTDYMYSHNSNSASNQYSNDQFAAMAPSYMMSMARSFSDSQLSEICSSPNLSGSTTVKMELCDSPSLYPQHAIFEEDYHYHNNGHNSHHQNLYSTQYHNHHNNHPHHHHSHSYSTSSLSTLSTSSDDSSSMSPRSTFSTGSLSLSSSSNSLATVAAGGPSYPLSRTLSEPSMMPIFQAMSTSSSMSDLSSLHDLSGVCNLDDSKSSLLLMAGSSPVTSSSSTTSGAPKRSRGRRVSSHPDNSGCKIFKCRFEDCGKIFKRSEHLKRHVRSIHTLEKPFECPINNCPKRFSRSDNLNQHIRIHRHTSGARAAEKHSKAMASFTPFLDTYSTGLLTL
ncbi:hypothetical protein EC991_008942 [Linnemannia zychae]|nr:hypothetical protein EC991_008942 [Linnemannia zychae]